MNINININKLSIVTKWILHSEKKEKVDHYVYQSQDIVMQFQVHKKMLSPRHYTRFINRIQVQILIYSLTISHVLFPIFYLSTSN